MAKRVTNKLHPITFIVGALTGSYFHGNYLKRTHKKEMEEYYKELAIVKDELEHIKYSIISRYKQTDRCKQLEKLWLGYRISKGSVDLNEEPYESTSAEYRALSGDSHNDSADHSSL